MAELILVPFVGTTMPSPIIVWENGLTTTNNTKLCYYSSSGNVNPVYYGRYTSANSEYLYLSYGTFSIVEALSSSSIGGYQSNNRTITGAPNIYCVNSQVGNYRIAVDSGNIFANFDAVVTAFRALSPPEGSMNIKYSIQNGSVIGPSWISPGGNVISYVTMQAGFSLTQQDISITRNGTAIPFTYSKGVLTFTAPSS